MSKLISTLAILIMSAALSVGSMWYAFGVPLKNVAALVIFTIAQFVLIAIMGAISNEKP